jgi:hypothetical protein
LPAARFVRDAQLTSVAGNAPLTGVVMPDPCSRSPSQIVVALLEAAILPASSVAWNVERDSSARRGCPGSRPRS